VTNQEFYAEMRQNHAEMSAQLDKLADRLGSPNDENNGGTGLTGEVLRMKTDVQGLLNFRNQGVGFIAAVALLGSLILIGLKGWITGIVDAIK
jgi:hypothetical protein